MPPQTDCERLAHFVELIGAEPRKAVFNNNDCLVELNLAGLSLTSLSSEIGQFIHLYKLILGEFVSQNEQFIALGNRLTNLPSEIGSLINFLLPYRKCVLK